MRNRIKIDLQHSLVHLLFKEMNNLLKLKYSGAFYEYDLISELGRTKMIDEIRRGNMQLNVQYIFYFRV